MAITKVTKCRSCEAAVVWLRTKRGKPILVDWDSIEDEETLRGENTTFRFGIHRTHFATCPQANDWRR